MIVPFSLPKSAVRMHAELTLKPVTEKELFLSLEKNRIMIRRKNRYRRCKVKLIRIYRSITSGGNSTACLHEATQAE